VSAPRSLLLVVGACPRLAFQGPSLAHRRRRPPAGPPGRGGERGGSPRMSAGPMPGVGASFSARGTSAPLPRYPPKRLPITRQPEEKTLGQAKDRVANFAFASPRYHPRIVDAHQSSATGILTRFPFAGRPPPQDSPKEESRKEHLQTITHPLRTASLTTICSSRETFVHFGLEASHSNNCYYHQDLHHWPFQPDSRPAFPTPNASTYSLPHT